MPLSSRRQPATSSTSPTSRVTTTTPKPTKSSAASSSSTASSNPLPDPPRRRGGGVAGSRLLLVGGEEGGELAATLYDAGFVAAGIDARCEARVVKPAELTDAVAHMRADTRVLGAAVTMPHTVAISRLLDGLGPEAQVVRAVDTISHRAGALIGWNTDRSAFNLALEEAGFQAKGRTALVLGAGGSARASVDALREAADKIWVVSRDLDEARVLCRDLDISSGGPSPLGSLSLLVRKVELIVRCCSSRGLPPSRSGLASPHQKPRCVLRWSGPCWAASAREPSAPGAGLGPRRGPYGCRLELPVTLAGADRGDRVPAVTPGDAADAGSLRPAVLSVRLAARPPAAAVH
ncbi:MAG: hypothetical protein E6I31_05545 [Chloroflexi bacterium]|nr:MAG: hypothetical protein E6I31_05545 [Chloroflexota bacterium]